MSNWTPKRALSGLMSKFRQSDSEESSNFSSGEGSAAPVQRAAQAEDAESPDEPMGLSTSDVSVSPLALMNENSPEAWLGQFLLKLDVPTSTARGTVEGAKRDADLLKYLDDVRASSAQAEPLRLLESGQGEQLKQQDWSAWWKAQGALLSYAYSVLALSMLGDRESVSDLGFLYKQDANMQMQKDAHYVLVYILGKPWPSYQVTEGDLRRLEDGA